MKQASLALTALAIAVALPGVATADGRLVIVGGGLRDDNHAVYAAFLEDAVGQADARVAVISAASGSPATAGARMRSVFQRYGVDGARIDLVQLALLDDRDTEQDESDWQGGAFASEQIALIERADAIWFTGGDQMRLTQLLLDDGADTPLLAAIRRRLEAGATLGGTSAGAAIMSRVMIQRGESLTALIEPVLGHVASETELESGRLSLGPGLGFFNLGLVDQHFEERARLGRLARAQIEQGQIQGFGIDEDTALVVDLEQGRLSIAGTGGVTWIDASHAIRQANADRFGVEGLTVTYLSSGDVVDLGAGELDVAAFKAATVGNEYFHTPAVAGGGMALPPSGLPEAIGEALLDNAAASTVERLSFRGDGAGVLYRFHQNGNSAGYWGRDSQGEARYTLVRVGFDIIPVDIAITPVTVEQDAAHD